MSAAFIRAAGKEETQEACGVKRSRRKTALHIVCDKLDHVTLQNVKSRQLRGLISPLLDCHSSVKPLNTCYTECPLFNSPLLLSSLILHSNTHNPFSVCSALLLPPCPPSLGCFL